MVINILKSIFMGTNNFYPRYEIMLKCWQNNPDVRPTFSDLKKQLKDMENQHRVRQVQGTIKLLPLCFFNTTFFNLYNVRVTNGKTKKHTLWICNGKIQCLSFEMSITSVSHVFLSMVVIAVTLTSHDVMFKDEYNRSVYFYFAFPIW